MKKYIENKIIEVIGNTSGFEAFELAEAVGLRHSTASKYLLDMFRRGILTREKKAINALGERYESKERHSKWYYRLKK